jgi:NDP-sugar pyrophosphorylase family protein
MPVGGEPLVRRIIAWLHGHGVRDVVMNLHHRPATLTTVVGDGSDLGVAARYSWEGPAILGSAGGPRHALPIIGSEEFLVVNGDTLTDVDLAAMISQHKSSHAHVTLAVVPNRAHDRYGGVCLDDHDRVLRFARRGTEAQGSWHFIGVQAVNAAVFASLPDNTPLSTIGGVYDTLIRTRPGSVCAFRCDARFWDVGTVSDYLATSRAFCANGLDAGRRTHIDPTARVRGCVLWDDVEVGADAELTECIATDHVRVPAGARYERAILQQRGDELVVTRIEP